MLRMIALSGLLLAGACSSSDRPPETSENAAPTPPKGNCVRNASINGFQVLDDQHLLVTAPTKSRTYLITTQSKCRELDYTNALLIKSFSGCVKKFDKIYIKDDFMSSRCLIDRVEWVADKDAALALIEAEKKAEETEKAVAEE